MPRNPRRQIRILLKLEKYFNTEGVRRVLNAEKRVRERERDPATGGFSTRWRNFRDAKEIKSEAPFLLLPILQLEVLLKIDSENTRRADSSGT